MKKFLTYTIYTALSALLFIPLIVANDMYFPFITGKNFAFRIFTEIIVSAWAVLAIWDRQYRPTFSWVLGAFGSLVVVMLLAAIFGANTYDSLFSNFERMEGWVTLLHLFGLFVAVASTLQTKEAYTRLFQGMIVAGTTVAFVGVAQLAGVYEIHLGGNRLDATLGNSSYLAIYMVFHIFVALYLFWQRLKNRLKRNISVFTGWRIWAYLALMALYTVILFYTQTRGAILGLFGGLGVTALLIAIFEQKYTTLRKISVGVIAFVVLVIGSFFAIKDTQFAKETPGLSRFAEIQLADIDERARVMIWGMAWEGFKDRPILGWGQGNFNYVFNKYYNPQMYDQEQWFDRAHNVLLDWLVGGGIIGLTVYLSIFVFGLYYLWERHKKTRGWLDWIKYKSSSILGYVRDTDVITPHIDVVSTAIISGLLAAYFGHNLFVFDNITSFVMFALVLAFIHRIASRTWKLFDTREDTTQDNWTRYGVPATAGVLLVASIYVFNWNGFMQAQTLIDALRLSSRGQLGGSYVHFQEALAYDSYGTQEVQEQLTQTAISLAANDQVPQNAEDRFVSLSTQEMKSRIKSEPLNARAPFFLGSLYRQRGEYEKAKKYYKQALELSPKKQAFLFDLGAIYLRQQEYTQAFDTLQKAYELAPEYQKARKLYATAAVYAKEFDVVESLAKEIRQSWENAAKDVSEIPQDKKSELAQFHISIASVYARIGEFDRAIEQVRTAIDILPEFEDRGQEFIRQLQKGEVPGQNSNQGPRLGT